MRTNKHGWLGLIVYLPVDLVKQAVGVITVLVLWLLIAPVVAAAAFVTKRK
jgi:hypothetical protein